MSEQQREPAQGEGAQPVLESGMGGADTGGSPGSVTGAGIEEDDARAFLERLGEDDPAEEPPGAG